MTVLSSAVTHSVVRRHMKHTSPGAFTKYVDGAKLPVDLSPALGETIAGWYRNPPPWQSAIIVFTSEALYVSDDGRLDRIAIADIVGYETPKSKTDITGVRIFTKTGFRFIRIAGSFGPSGNQKDAFSFIMIIRALVGGESVRGRSSDK